jgi:soluble lytic murein transglycosylase-like protein
MGLSLSRYFALFGLALAALVPAAPAQAARARGDGAESQFAVRHHRGHTAYSPHRHFARHYRHGLYAYAYADGDSHETLKDARSFGSYAGESFHDSYGSRQHPAAIAAYDGMIAEQASTNGIPTSLIERVIKRESGGNPRAVSSGNFGLMQIRLGTAGAMGYGGSAAGLLDAATNMTYAVRYLAGAYRAAGGNESRAVALYARGYNAGPVQAGPSYEALGEPGTLRPTEVAYGWQPLPYRVAHFRHRRI